MPKHGMRDIQEIFDWLVDGASGSADVGDIVQRMSDHIVAAGIPVDRVAAIVETLHPQFVGRAFYWTRGGTVQVREAARADTRPYSKSPLAAIHRTGQPLRLRLGDPASLHEYVLVEDLAADGFTDYLAAPLNFLSGERHVVTFATRTPTGFSETHVAALLHLVRPLTRIAEILALRRTAVSLLNTYVGHDAGDRILRGKIQRGDIDMIHAIIWCSDLRAFTELASTLDPAALIAVLNEVFECQVTAIQHCGGQVLKFIGDGLLAIFPTESAQGNICDDAFDAATRAFRALAALNEARASRGQPSVRFGLALHLGTVAYGNIGGVDRLDFTCIGPAVNLASRLEGLTGKLERPVVVSAEIARLTTRRLAELGTFKLKGVRLPQPVFAPTEEPLASW
jgi:adenylate cyclase